MQKKNLSELAPNPILGIGTDIIEIHRIQEAISKHGTRFLDRLFTDEEQKYCQGYADAVPRFAGRFAAKEAVVKALGTGVLPEIQWREIEILNNPAGKPEVHFSARLQQTYHSLRVLVSISHCESYATATAILIT